MALRLTRQTFFETAKRRGTEARILLHAPSAYEYLHSTCRPLRGWSWDGAVTCGLLAAECALKATLLHGHTADQVDELPASVGNGLFDSSEGHKIRLLWDRQARSVTNIAPEDLAPAIDRLHLPDRYQLRYGGRRLTEVEAKPFVECSETIVAWMKQVFA